MHSPIDIVLNNRLILQHFSKFDCLYQGGIVLLSNLEEKKKGL